MSLIAVPESDLKAIVRFYSKLVRKNNGNMSMRALYIAKRRPYTRELDARGIKWQCNRERRKDENSQ